jgi:hypothetical protein
VRRLAAAAALAGAAVLLAGSAPAEAAQLPATCRANASKIRQPDPLAPLVVGDSVTVAAGKYLAAEGFSVDAVACRAWSHGLEAMAGRRLPDVLVVALGSNGDLFPEQLEQTLELVGPFARLVLVLPKALGGGADRDGRLMRAFAEAHPDQVDVLDWPAYSAGEPGWFAPDGLHLTTPGAHAFTALIAEGVAFSQPEQVEPPPVEKPARPRRPRRTAPRTDPLVAEAWRAFSDAVASFVGPALRLLGRVALRPADLGHQDL